MKNIFFISSCKEKTDADTFSKLQLSNAYSII